MLVKPGGLSLQSWQDEFASASGPADLADFSQQFADLDEDAVIFDCTASDAPCDFYQTWMSAGVHVVTPNKKLHSGPLERYRAVRQLQADGAAHYFYEVRPALRRMLACLFGWAPEHQYPCKPWCIDLIALIGLGGLCRMLSREQAEVGPCICRRRARRACQC